jgi:hypothetical protein
MKFILCIILSLLSFSTFAQTPQLEHPRVMELEDNMVKEASSYFARRYPGDPFFIQVKVQPLRRIPVKGDVDESLPYHDGDSEEIVDEWDDPATSLSFLRNRVVKVFIEVSVPLSFDEQKVTDIKQELSVYLRLIPFRDEVKVEKKLKIAGETTPNYVFYIVGGFVGAALLLGLMLRWSLGTIKTQNTSTGSSPSAGAMPAMMASQAPSSNSSSSSTHGKTDVQGDVTFHDPIKTLDIVHKKLIQIEQSNTFPTLKDVIELDSLCQGDPSRFGALIYEFSQESQTNIFKMGRDTKWLQAFTSAGGINQNCLTSLDRMVRERNFNASDRDYEDLLIQIWRLGDKAISFCKSIDSEHAFIILNLIPKSFSLQIAKKAFPGSWGKLLENRSSNVVIDPKIIKDYLRKALELEPWFQAKMLENYKKDKELLSYLDKVNIEDEKDIYDTLHADSFILKVRPAFYKVFELEADKFASVIEAFPIEKWALVLMNSSRNYIRIVSEKLDDKKKMVFSTHLKRLDQAGINFSEQNHWKNLMAKEAQKYFQVDPTANTVSIEKGAESESQRHSA